MAETVPRGARPSFVTRSQALTSKETRWGRYLLTSIMLRSVSLSQPRSTSFRSFVHPSKHAYRTGQQQSKSSRVTSSRTEPTPEFKVNRGRPGASQPTYLHSAVADAYAACQVQSPQPRETGAHGAEALQTEQSRLTSYRQHSPPAGCHVICGACGAVKKGPTSARTSSSKFSHPARCSSSSS